MHDDWRQDRKTVIILMDGNMPSEYSEGWLKSDEEFEKLQV